MPYEKSKSNNSFPHTSDGYCMVGLCVVWNRTEIFLYDLPLVLVTLTSLLKNNESTRFDKLELALEVLALLAMVYFTVFMLLPF